VVRSTLADKRKVDCRKNSLGPPHFSGTVKSFFARLFSSGVHIKLQESCWMDSLSFDEKYILWSGVNGH